MSPKSIAIGFVLHEIRVLRPAQWVVRGTPRLDILYAVTVLAATFITCDLTFSMFIVREGIM